jgi:hypothetical protein
LEIWSLTALNRSVTCCLAQYISRIIKKQSLPLINQNEKNFEFLSVRELLLAPGGNVISRSISVAPNDGADVII